MRIAKITVQLVIPWGFPVGGHYPRGSARLWNTSVLPFKGSRADRTPTKPLLTTGGKSVATFATLCLGRMDSLSNVLIVHAHEDVANRCLGAASPTHALRRYSPEAAATPHADRNTGENYAASAWHRLALRTGRVWQPVADGNGRQCSCGSMDG